MAFLLFVFLSAGFFKIKSRKNQYKKILKLNTQGRTLTQPDLYDNFMSSTKQALLIDPSKPANFQFSQQMNLQTNIQKIQNDNKNYDSQIVSQLMIQQQHINQNVNNFIQEYQFYSIFPPKKPQNQKRQTLHKTQEDVKLFKSTNSSQEKLPSVTTSMHTQSSLQDQLQKMFKSSQNTSKFDFHRFPISQKSSQHNSKEKTNLPFPSANTQVEALSQKSKTKLVKEKVELGIANRINKELNLKSKTQSQKIKQNGQSAIQQTQQINTNIHKRGQGFQIKEIPKLQQNKTTLSQILNYSSSKSKTNQASQEASIDDKYRQQSLPLEKISLKDLKDIVVEQPLIKNLLPQNIQSQHKISLSEQDSNKQCEEIEIMSESVKNDVGDDVLVGEAQDSNQIDIEKENIELVNNEGEINIPIDEEAEKEQSPQKESVKVDTDDLIQNVHQFHQKKVVVKTQRTYKRYAKLLTNQRANKKFFTKQRIGNQKYQDYLFSQGSIISRKMIQTIQNYSSEQSVNQLKMNQLKSPLTQWRSFRMAIVVKPEEGDSHKFFDFKIKNNEENSRSGSIFSQARSRPIRSPLKSIKKSIHEGAESSQDSDNEEIYAGEKIFIAFRNYIKKWVESFKQVIFHKQIKPLSQLKRKVVFISRPILELKLQEVHEQLYVWNIKRSAINKFEEGMMFQDYSDEENCDDLELIPDSNSPLGYSRRERKIVLPELLNELDENSRNMMLSQQETIIPSIKILKEFYQNLSVSENTNQQLNDIQTIQLFVEKKSIIRKLERYYREILIGSNELEMQIEIDRNELFFFLDPSQLQLAEEEGLSQKLKIQKTKINQTLDIHFKKKASAILETKEDSNQLKKSEKRQFIKRPSFIIENSMQNTPKNDSNNNVSAQLFKIERKNSEADLTEQLNKSKFHFQNQNQSKKTQSEIIQDLIFKLIEYGRLHEISEYLEDYRINIDYQDQLGNTYLIFAAQQGDEQIIRLLLKKSANKHISNNKDQK